MIRLLDIILSASALLVLSPLLVPLTIALRVTGEGEVFFKQDRVGRGGQYFKLYKFATMLADSPNMGTGTLTLKDDPRVLPLGRFLRKTKVNELPQLINIFLGDMSIIGPRPQTRRCFEAFPSRAQGKIIKVLPGLSGIGSIVFRGEEQLMSISDDPNTLYDIHIMPYKGYLEEWFVENRSLSVYLKCIWLTVVIVIKPSSELVWRFFPDLPEPPEPLARKLNWRIKDE